MLYCDRSMRVVKSPERHGAQAAQTRQSLRARQYLLAEAQARNHDATRRARCHESDCASNEVELVIDRAWHGR
jgi:hypothetical protein